MLRYYATQSRWCWRLGFTGVSRHSIRRSYIPNRASKISIVYRSARALQHTAAHYVLGTAKHHNENNGLTRRRVDDANTFTKGRYMRKIISKDYLQQQIDLHKNLNYGVASLGYAPIVKDLFVKISAKSISDYGAGKCNLRVGLEKIGLSDFSYYPYDPVFPEYGPPTQGDLVCCIDVLEHVEIPFVDSVLKDLASITKKVGFFTIATGPAMKILPDGRNAHLIQKPTSWWLPKLVRFFEIQRLQTEGTHGFWVIVTPVGK